MDLIDTGVIGKRRGMNNRGWLEELESIAANQMTWRRIADAAYTQQLHEGTWRRIELHQYAIKNPNESKLSILVYLQRNDSLDKHWSRVRGWGHK